MAHTLKFQTTTLLSFIIKEDVEDLLSTLKTHKSVGPSSIPTKIPKDFKKYFLKSISDRIKLSFSLDIFPEVLKQATLLSIFWIGDQHNCNNYSTELNLRRKGGHFAFNYDNPTV